jgi:lysophospholipase L1-like esterase
MKKLFNLLTLALLVSACGKGPPIQPYCPGPANDTSPIHFFGDSITYGGGNSVNGVPFGYAQMMGQDLNLAINDVAVPASLITQCGQLPSILGSTIQSNQIYIFFTGTNDAHTNQGTDLPSFTSNFQIAYNYLTATGAKVLFIGPYYLLQDTTTADKAVVDSFNTAIQGVAGNLYIDLRNVIDPNTMLTDGVHPNATGHEAIAAVVETALSNL